LKERAALQIMSMIGRDYYSGANDWTLERLAKALNLACETVAPVLEALEQGGLLSRTADEPTRYLPARPLDETPLSAVIQAVRRAEEQRTFGYIIVRPDPAIEALSGRIDRAIDAVLTRQTLKHLALGEDVEAEAAGGPVDDAARSGRDRRPGHSAKAARTEVQGG
ncbi:MAG: hypothetical protein ACXW25_05315, partial [Rhodospirillales bacterium]